MVQEWLEIEIQIEEAIMRKACCTIAAQSNEMPPFYVRLNALGYLSFCLNQRVAIIFCRVVEVHNIL